MGKGTRMRSKYECMFRNVLSKHNDLLVLYKPLPVLVDMHNRGMAIERYTPASGCHTCMLTGRRS